VSTDPSHPATPVSPARFVEADGLQMPPGGEALFATMRDGARLRVAMWPDEAPRASVIVLPGRTEFIEKYGEVIGELRARRCGVGIVDWRGQGLSERPLADPLRGHVDSFDTFVDDLVELMAGPFARLPGPRLMLAHSMGGTIGLLTLARRPDLFAGAAFSSPLLGVKTPPLPVAAAHLIASAGCAMGLGDRLIPGGTRASVAEEAFAGNPVTHDERRHRRPQTLVQAEPALGLGSPTLGWLHAALSAIAALAAPGTAESIAVPSLIALAADESVTDGRGAEAFARRMPHAKLVQIAGARHEILMEVDAVRTRFWQEYDAFVDTVLRPAGRAE
jgi:lysophospholipase